MTDYICLFRTSASSNREHMGSPEQAQKSMELWLAWMRELEQNGALVSPGQPLDLGGKVVRGQQRTITDGPFVEAKDLIAGYTIIRAESLAHAAELVKGCPILEGDGSVEVRPVVAM